MNTRCSPRATEMWVNLWDKCPYGWLRVTFLQIKPAKEISIADDLDARRQAGAAVHPEHYTAQDAMLGITSAIHLTKSKRFLDEASPAVMQAVRTSRPDALLPEEEPQQLRRRKIENCQGIRTPKH